MWLSLLIKDNSFSADRNHCRNQEQVKGREQKSMEHPTPTDTSITQALPLRPKGHAGKMVKRLLRARESEIAVS